MAKAPKKSVAAPPVPILQNGKVPLRGRTVGSYRPRGEAAPSPALPPRRQSNLDRRSREYLTPAEVEKLLQASSKVGRHGARDRTLLLLAYRHGLRVSELVTMRWEQIDLKAGLVHVARLKNGLASTHPIRGPELRALRETVRKLIARAGELAKLPFPIHPHMLRHSAGYKLANEGHDTRSIQQYLGHRNITHTVRYTELSPERFKNFWKD